jgi:hypothetical protein
MWCILKAGDELAFLGRVEDVGALEPHRCKGVLLGVVRRSASFAAFSVTNRTTVRFRRVTPILGSRLRDRR